MELAPPSKRHKGTGRSSVGTEPPATDGEPIALAPGDAGAEPMASAIGTASSAAATQTEVNGTPAVSVGTQTIQLGGVKFTVRPSPPTPTASASPTAASSGVSPPVTPVDLATSAGTSGLTLTPKHAEIAAIASQLAPHEQQEAALLAQQEEIAAQRKELNRQAAAIRAGLEDLKPKLLPARKKLREVRGYLQLVDTLEKPEPAIKAAQSRLALAGLGHARIGRTALLQNLDVAECISKHIESACDEACKQAKYGARAANARRQLAFGIRLDGMHFDQFNGVYTVSKELGGFPVLHNRHKNCIFWHNSRWHAGTEDCDIDTFNDTSGGAKCAAQMLRCSKDGYIPTGINAWDCWDSDSEWIRAQVAVSILRTEAEVADAKQAEQSAFDLLLKSWSADVISQLAGSTQIVVSGLPFPFVAHSNNNGTYRALAKLVDGFPCFKRELDESSGYGSRFLIFSVSRQCWAIAATPCPHHPDPDTSSDISSFFAIASNIDCKLPVGLHPWRVWDNSESKWTIVSATLTTA